MKFFYQSLPYLALCCFFCGCVAPEEKKTVLAIPVYGQSLALGKEAIRITNFDSLTTRTDRRVLTENLDEKFGYFSDNRLKQWLKKTIKDKRRSFELSIYGMSEVLLDSLMEREGWDNVIIATFPGGKGATAIAELGKGSRPYKKQLDEIKRAHRKAKKRGWEFSVPAFCWMQGETDIDLGTSAAYKEQLKKFQRDLNTDIKAITKQSNDVVCISYQTNSLTVSNQFDASDFNGCETSIPQSQMELIIEDSLFAASGPTYPYTFVDERVHIDGTSQKRLGYLAGLAVLNVLDGRPNRGLLPSGLQVNGDTVIIHFNVQNPPLVIDTVAVEKAENYGFSVIDSLNSNMLSTIVVEENTVKLICTSSPVGMKVRYAVNGIPGKNGNKNGPRGNLRDSQGETLQAHILNKAYPLHNWCYQFDVLLN